jgi:SAM-dependent methyltransferase
MINPGENLITLEDQRIRREKEFHDSWAASVQIEDVLVKEAFESPTAIENRYILDRLGNLSGKKILDLGCGYGDAAVYFALKGAEVYAVDVSGECLKVTGRLAQKYGVQIHSLSCSATQMPFPDGFFDHVYGNGVLHHIDLVPSSHEIHRVLKKGGSGYFIEPLPYNPVINVYREMAKDVRTPDEKPLTYRQIGQMKNIFTRLDHQEFWFLSLLIFLHFFFIKRWHPSKVRYWKKVLEVGEEYKGMFSRLQALDRGVFKIFPFLRSMSWTTVIEVIK